MLRQKDNGKCKFFVTDCGGKTVPKPMYINMCDVFEWDEMSIISKI